MKLDCGHEPSEHTNSTTGYGVDREGKKHCYACCAEKDKEAMRQKGKAILYLTEKEVTNWPGSLRIPVNYQKKGRHNIAGSRIDVWFHFEGKPWHGVQYGEWTQIVHCKALAS